MKELRGTVSTFVIVATVMVVILSGCVANKVVDYPDTKITKIVKDYTHAKATVYAIGSDSESRVTSLEFKLNSNAMITKPSSSASFTFNLDYGTNTVYVASKNASGNVDPTPASTSIYAWFPVIKSNQLVTDEGSPLKAKVNVWDKEYKTSALSIDATSDKFEINNISLDGSNMIYDLVPKDNNFNGTAHLYISAKAPNGLHSDKDIPIKVNPMTDLYIKILNMIIEHPSDNAATVTGHRWSVGSNQLVKVYEVPVTSVNSSPAIITVNPDASSFVYKGYTDANGELHIKVKPVEYDKGLYRIIDTGINKQGQQVLYKSKQWVDASNDQDVTLVNTTKDDWFELYFTTANHAVKPYMIEGTMNWPRELEGHPPIYILTGGRWSASPTTRVMNDVKEYIKLLYPGFKGNNHIHR